MSLEGSDRVTDTIGNTGRLSLAESILFAVVFLGFALLVTYPIRSYDLFWHIANGKAMFEQGRIIQEDIFSYTETGKHFTNHWWLSQILLYIVYKTAGTAGLAMFKVLMVLAIAWVFYRCSSALGGDRAVTLLLLLAAFLVDVWTFSIRPQLFSFFFLALTAYLLYSAREGKLRIKYLFALVPVFVIWDFMHGALYGLILLGAFTSGETLKTLAAYFWQNDKKQIAPFIKMLWAVVACVLAAMFISPFGLRTYSIFMTVLDKSIASFALTLEFLPPGFEEFHLFFILLTTACIMAFASLFRKFDITNIFVLAPFAYLALKYNRVTAVFALLTVPILSYQYQVFVSSFKLEAVKKASRGIVLILIAASLIYIANFKFISPTYNSQFGLGLNDNRLPVAASRFVKYAGLDGPMFNSDMFGGYFSYFLYPERKIYMYNLPEVFDREIMESTKTDFLYIYDFSYAVVSLDHPLTQMVMRGNTQWHVVFWDYVSAVLVREVPRNRDVIDRFGLVYLLPGMSMEEIKNLATKLPPARLLRFAREISTELQFAQDNVLADFFGELLVSRPDVFTPELRDELARFALEQNRESSRLKDALISGEQTL
jgi:hypothetical protein